MTTSLIIAILGTISKVIDLYSLMISKASDEDAAKLMAVAAEREAWWQQNIWGPIGRFLASEEPSTDDSPPSAGPSFPDDSLA